MNISLRNLMVLERILLEMNARMRFDIDFSEAYELYVHLKDVGRITSYSFLIQDEYAKEHNDKELIVKYHEKVIGSSVDFDYSRVTSFIDKINKAYDNEGFSSIVSKFRFW